MKSERHKKCERWERIWEKGTIDTVYCKAWNCCWQVNNTRNDEERKEKKIKNWNLAVWVIRHDVDACLMWCTMYYLIYLLDMSMALNRVVNVLLLSFYSSRLIAHIYFPLIYALSYCDTSSYQFCNKPQSIHHTLHYRCSCSCFANHTTRDIQRKVFKEKL